MRVLGSFELDALAPRLNTRSKRIEFKWIEEKDLTDNKQTHATEKKETLDQTRPVAGNTLTQPTPRDNDTPEKLPQSVAQPVREAQQKPEPQPAPKSNPASESVNPRPKPKADAKHKAESKAKAKPKAKGKTKVTGPRTTAINQT